MLILAALFARYDWRDFYVRRVLKRVELGELRPRDAALLLGKYCEQEGDRV
jgi:hypothetical protein